MAAISGQKTVTTAGTAVALGTERIAGTLIVKALATNTGDIYIGNDGTGDVDEDTGFVLDAGEDIAFLYVGDLSSIMIDSSVNGEGVSWSRAEVM